MSSRVDETYLEIRDRRGPLYRAIDRDGNLIDAVPGEHRDMRAAKALFRSAQAVTGCKPERVTTDAMVPTRTLLGAA